MGTMAGTGCYAWGEGDMGWWRLVGKPGTMALCRRRPSPAVAQWRSENEGERRCSAGGLTSSGARLGWALVGSEGPQTGIARQAHRGAPGHGRLGELGAAAVLREVDCERAKWGRGEGAGVCEAQKELGSWWLREGGMTWASSLGVRAHQRRGGSVGGREGGVRLTSGAAHVRQQEHTWG